MSPQEQEYYSSHSRLNVIGVAGQEKLKAASVLVVGAGGLGCPCLLHLATAGVGRIGIADFDKVSLSNLHRQTLYTFQDIGRNKVEAATQSLRKHNPFIEIVEHRLLVDFGNVLELLQGYDLIIDCTDNFEVRYLLNDACVSANKALVYGAIHQTEGHVTVFNYQGSGTLRCLFPDADTGAVQSCAEIGAYNITVSVIGSMMANEAIKVLLGHPDVFANKLVCADVLAGTIRQIKYRPLPESCEISMQRFAQSEKPLSISPESYFKEMVDKPHLLLDVRESYQHERFNIGGENIPLDELVEMKQFEALDKENTIILYCQQGNRSIEAVKFLRNSGFVNAYSLSGGILSAKNHF